MRRPAILLILIILATPLLLTAETYTGKCVGVTDGDTISVMKAGKAVKIRLDGIDCPERGQDFGTRARQFTSDMVFGKEVQVLERDKDRYGRIVARIIVDGKDVSLELIKAGLAWHYKQYSTDPVLAEAEVVARKGKAGLWAKTGAEPPWEWRSVRRGKR